MHNEPYLVWDGTRGYMSCSGVRLSLRRAAYVPGVSPYDEIDFAPSMGRHSVRRAGVAGDLTGEERSIIDAWLRRWSLGARESVTPWDGWTERRAGDRRLCGATA